jgi:hypothetical protein
MRIAVGARPVEMSVLPAGLNAKRIAGTFSACSEIGTFDASATCDIRLRMNPSARGIVTCRRAWHLRFTNRRTADTPAYSLAELCGGAGAWTFDGTAGNGIDDGVGRLIPIRL